MSETPEQRRQLKRRYQEILLYLNQIAEKTGLSPYQIADCAAGNVQLGRSDTQKILDAIQSLDAPESGDTNKKTIMARSKNGPKRGEPRITPDRGIQLLWEQIEKARQLVALPLLHEGDFETWDNTTTNYVEDAFGENHRNIQHFALQEGPTTYLPQSANQLSDRYKKTLHLKIPALVGYIEQLKNKCSSEESHPLETMGTNQLSKKIFVVHGHDTAALDQLELILHRLELDPFILQNTAGDGLTIIEALEEEIGRHSGAARFGIVLLTPDDVGYAISAGPSHAKPRARQNVVLEMGMLVSAIGRKNVVILKKGDVEVPSDAQGIIYAQFTAHVKEVVPKIVQRLNAAGFELNPDAIGKASM